MSLKIEIRGISKNPVLCRAGQRESSLSQITEPLPVRAMEQVANQDTQTVRTVAHLEKDLYAIEQHLHSAEQKYLESTGHGNVMKGWKELLTVGKINTRRKDRVDPRDKVPCRSYFICHSCVCVFVLVNQFAFAWSLSLSYFIRHLTSHTYTHTTQVFSASSMTAPDFDGRKEDNSSDSDSSD